ncbi:MAG: ComEC/Rec2 family competence protein [Phycisphaera sp. TMED24]|nr:MAG: ComEC/Rec2 family competence protein [Phycisphaera sp. TMED24]
MHVLGPPPIPAESIGLLGLLLLGLGWKCRRGRARTTCLGLCGFCAVFWIQATSPHSRLPGDPGFSTISGTVHAIETKPRIPEWQHDPRRPPPSRWMKLRTNRGVQRVLLPQQGSATVGLGDKVVCGVTWLSPRPPVWAGGAAKDTQGVAVLRDWQDVLVDSKQIPRGTIPWSLIKTSHQDRVAESIRHISGSSNTTREWLNALVLGNNQGRSLQAWRDIGLGHMAAISGMHVSMLIFAALIPLRMMGIPMAWQAIASLVVIVVLLFTVPWKTPILRASLQAALMVPMFLGAGRWYFLGTLAGVAAFLLIGNAQHLSSIGFQCSFVATAALGLAMPQLQWRPYDDWPRRMARMVLVMCAPWLAVLPLGVYHFGVIHPYGAVLTVIASPVLSLILPILWGSVFLGLIFPELASTVGLVVAPILIALQWILDSLSTLPWVKISTNFFRPDAVLTTALVTAGLLFLISGRMKWSISAMVFGLLCSPDLRLNVGEQDEFRWDALSVGNGSAHLLQMGSKSWLIDAGSSGELHVSRRCILPALRNQNIRRLEGIVCTHADLDHIAGVVPILQAMPVGILRIPPLMLREAQDDVTSPCHTLLATAKEMDVTVIITTRGDRWESGSSTFKTLWPPRDLNSRNRNHASLAFEVLVHGRRLRFSGDADSKLMISEIQNEAPADVFELPHHGARCLGLETILRKRPPRLLLQSSSRRRAQKGPWHTWPGSPHLATGLHGGICIQVDSSGCMTAAAQNRFYTWPREP